METLKRIHRWSGRLFFLVFMVGAVWCIFLLSESKAELTPRATLHAFCAVSIFLLFLLKISFLRRYREFYGYVKVIGILLFLLSLNLVFFSTGFSIVTGQKDEQTLSAKSKKVEPFSVAEGDVGRGKRLFRELCASCHYTDRKDFKRGAPGLKGLFAEKELPVSKKPVTVENVISQIKNPIRYMPAFTDLDERQLSDLIAYLKTL